MDGAKGEPGDGYLGMSSNSQKTSKNLLLKITFGERSKEPKFMWSHQSPDDGFKNRMTKTVELKVELKVQSLNFNGQCES